MEIITVLLGQLPQVLVCVVAMSVALARWSRHPQASMLVTIGATLELGAAIGSAVAMTVLRDRMSSLTLMFTVMHLGAVIGFGCIVAAVFTERGEPPPA